MKLRFGLLATIAQFGTQALFLLWHIDFGGYYWVFYTPLFVVRALFWGLLGSHKDRTVTGLNLFRKSKAGFTAVYLQSCIWQIFFVALLIIRPIYFYHVVSGAGDSPCGKSSCSRDHNINKFTDDYKNVYNPAGWFPTGEYETYDKMGTTEYVFCDFPTCHWADDNKKKTVKYHRMSNPQCTANRERPWKPGSGETESDTLMTMHLEDYPNPGRGMMGGFYACKGNPNEISCPGNLQEADPQITKGSGRKVCSVCGKYRNSYKAVIGVSDDFGQPDIFADPYTHCAPKADRSVNVLCPFVCPWASEATEESDLVTLLLLNVALALEPMFCIIVVLHGMKHDAAVVALHAAAKKNEEKPVATLKSLKVLSKTTAV